VAGVDPESTPLVAFAIVASLLLAAGCWFQPQWRWLLVVTAVAMAAFVVLDLRELIHQLDESNTGLAVMAVVVAILHVAAAVTAVTLRRRSSGREVPGRGLNVFAPAASEAARILAVVAVLGGEPAVPCTRNPLQRG
jgi:hypothetical protein